MAGMKLKNGADLCGFELRRFTIQNDSSDPTDLKVGRKYFNNGGGTAHLRERIYVGDKTITTDGWRDAAYMDDIKRLEGIIGSLDGNVGDNLLGLAEQLNAVQAKVDAFLEGDVDADAVLENLNELKQFLDTYSGDVTLSQVLNDINEEVAKKVDKATTLAGYGITDAAKYYGTYSVDSARYGVGYDNMSQGSVDLPVAGGGFIAATQGKYGFQIIGGYSSAGHMFWRRVDNDALGTWRMILDSENYASVLGTVYAPYNAAGYLPLSGGSVTGNIAIDGRLSVTAEIISKQHYLFARDNDNADWVVTTKGWTKEYALLHTGNYENIVGEKFLKQTGGTITGNILVSVASQSPIVIKNTAQEWVGLGFAGKNNSGYAFISYTKNDDGSEGWVVTNDGWSKVSTLLHSDNYYKFAPKLDGTGATGRWGIGLAAEELTDLNDARHGFLFTTTANYGTTDGNKPHKSHAGGLTWAIAGNSNYRAQLASASDSGSLYFRNMFNGTWGDWKTLAFTDSNVASATKLHTARSLWGNTFDGTADINTNLKFNADDTALSSWKKDGSSASLFLQVNPDRHVLIGQGTARENGGLYLYGNDIRMCYGNAGSSNNTAMLINNYGNVTIGASDLASTNHKLYVSGGLTRINSGLQVKGHTSFFSEDNDAYVTSFYTNGSGLTIQPRIEDVGYTDIFLNPSGGNVLIGTTTDRGHKLTIARENTAMTSSSLHNSALFIGSITDTDSYGLNLWTEGSGKGFIQQGRTDEEQPRLYDLILQPFGGNVGIGIANPQYKLDVNGTFRAQCINIKGSNEINAVDNSGSPIALCLNWSSTGNVILAQGGGNVGIGTTNAPYKFNVAGNAIFNSAGNGLLIYERKIRRHTRGVVESTYAMDIQDDYVAFNARLSPNINNTVTLGSDSYRWANTYSVLGDFSSRVLIGGAADDGWISLQVKGAADIDGVLYINAHSKEGIYFTENGVHWHNTAAGWVSTLFGFVPNNIIAHKLITAQSGIEIPTEQTLKIGDATLSWDSVNNALKVDKSFYSTEEVSAGGIGSGTTSGGGGGTNNTKAFDIPIGTESMTFAHNLGTKDVIVAIYEISDSYQQVLADVIINNISEVTIMFGEATKVAHRVVIMG